MHDEIGSQIERTLQNRCAKAVIDHDKNASLMCDSDQRRNIGYFGQRIGWRFEEKQLGFRAYGLGPGLNPGLRHEAGLHAEARHDIAQQLLSRAEQARRGNDMVAGTAQGHDQREDGRHAGSRCNACLRTFQGCQPFLKGGDGRIGEA